MSELLFNNVKWRIFQLYNGNNKLLYDKAVNTYIIVFGLTRPTIEPTNCCNLGENANHYTIETSKHCFVLFSNFQSYNNALKWNGETFFLNR